MSARPLRRIFLSIAIVCAALLPSTACAQVMYAHHLDVGQADCTLLEFPCGAVLIDAGADSGEEAALVEWLEEFFATRPDLNHTLDAVFITHAHIDHTRALREIAETFTIRNYIDNGHRDNRGGGGDQRWLAEQAQSGALSVNVRPVADSEITELSHRVGLTDEAIDPLSCDLCDPEIRILAGGLDENPGWPSGDFANDNNHSLVIRVDFGASSFLYTGDLEDHAILTLVDFYDGTGILDVDIYQVGHHGSHNGTEEALVEAMTPHAAIISMGEWEDGRRPDGSVETFSTYNYGHPRLTVIEMLEEGIPGYRSQSRWVKVATGSRKFVDHRVRKRLYGTGWDGDVVVRATLDRKYRITVENHD